MKRAGNLIPQIANWDNFLLAAHRAARGKRGRDATRQFFSNLQRNVTELIHAVQSGRLPAASFSRFVIYDPKKRCIHAPSFRERVLHHGIMNVCEPYLERRLIADTFACRQGLGQHAAVARAVEFSRRFPCFLKMDIRSFFDSVDHDILNRQLTRVFRETHLLRIFHQIIESFSTAPGRGLPIGSLTSQHLANSYLGPVDRQVKETLQLKGYARYMDDFVVWSDSTRHLTDIRQQLMDFASRELRLEIKPNTVINHVRHGFDFLGCRIFPGWAELSRRSRRRLGQSLHMCVANLESGRLTEREVQQRLEALVALPRAVRSWKFRRSLLKRIEGGI